MTATKPTLTMEAAVADCRRRGWMPVPLTHGADTPVHADWRTVPRSEREIGTDFAAGPRNLGVALGEASNGLVAVKLACLEAMRLAVILPPTDCAVSRAGAPYAQLYRGIVETTSFADPRDGAALIRSAGDGLAVMPPSVLGSAPLAFERSGEPATVATRLLADRMEIIAASALLARCWPPTQSERDQLGAAFSLMCLHAGKPRKFCTVLLKASAKSADDSNIGSLLSVVDEAERQLAAGKGGLGWSRMVEVVGEPVASCVQGWLKLEASASPPTASNANLREVNAASGSAYDGLMELVEALAHPPQPKEISAAIDAVRVARLNNVEQVIAIDAIHKRTKLSKSELRGLLDQKRGAPAEDIAIQIADQTKAHCFNKGAWIRFTQDRGFWVYDGKRWSRCEAQGVRQQITRVIREAKPGGASAASLTSRALRHLEDAVFAPGDPFSLAGDVPTIANVQNGELWIDPSGDVELRTHTPASNLVHVLDVTYDEGAHCPRFDQALNEIFATASDPAGMARHFYEFMGYAIQPRRHLAAFFVLHGEGSNGKSKLLQTVQKLMGDQTVYNGRMKNLESSRFALGHLVGKLLLVDDDMMMGDSIADGLMKQISEGKVLTAERKFGGSYQFLCRALPVLIGNNLPRVGDASYGLERRAHVIPFTRSFKEGEADPTLFDAIWREELPGILNGALAGLKRLLANGRFLDPADCLEAKQDWLNEATPLRRFIEECCEPSPGKSWQTRQLYAALVQWARENGQMLTTTDKQIGPHLRHLGHKIRKVHGYPEVLGLRPRAPRTESP